MPLVPKLHHSAQYVWQWFLQLNLFKTSSSDENTVPKERIATRLYVCLLACAVLIIAIVTASLLRTVSTTEYSPQQTRFSYLANKYPDTIFCPCSNIGISYDTFVSTHARFHQVCSSQFVQQTWIDMVFTQQNYTSYSSDDVRNTVSFFWQVIAGLCKISDTTWFGMVVDFNASYAFSPVAVTEQVMRLQTQVALSNAISSVRIKLTLDLLGIQRIMSGNQVVSGLATNFYPRYWPVDDNSTQSLRMSPRRYDNCSCMNTHGCPHPATINNANGEKITIPGMIADCFVIDATLASTFECYYDQSCMSLLHSSLSTSMQPLSDALNKYFTRNSTIQMLLNRIMIDEITSDVQFDSFYSECSPSYCFYSYARRFDVLFVATTIIGIFGGVSFVLRIIAKVLAVLILRWKNKRMPKTDTPHVVVPRQRKVDTIIMHFRSLLTRIRSTIINLNLFYSVVPRAATIISREILLTRLFILLLTISSISAACYTFLLVEPQLVTVQHPSFAVYEQLYNDHADTLQCPCSKQSIPYGSFLNVTFTLHQVCSSDLISPIWLNYLELFDPIMLPSWSAFDGTQDFRTTGNAYFQLLNTFCSLAKSNIEDAQSSFRSIQLVSDRVLDPSLFGQQTSSIITSHKRSTQNDFQRILNWILFAFTSSYFLTGANTNSDMFIDDNNDVLVDKLVVVYIDQINRTYASTTGVCACPVEFRTCGALNLLYTNRKHDLDYERLFQELPVGCMPLSGFLRSTFTWWYQQDYLNDIERTYSLVIHGQSSPSINALDASLPTQYENQNMEHLLNEMFIELPIRHQALFSLYYDQCAPSSCSYTVVKRRDLLVALLLLISVCGGLDKILRIIVRACGKLIYFLIDWRHNRQNAHVSPSVFNQFKHLCTVSRNTIININLYETASTNDIDLRQQRLHTRIYIIMFAICLGLILFYTAISQQSVTNTYRISSIEDHEQMMHVYQNNINCPCTRVSIPYNEFVTELRVETIHQACSTNLIRMSLVAGSYRDDGQVFPNSKDFRNFIDVFCDGLEQLCSLAQQNVERSIALFHGSSMLVKELIPRIQFHAEMNAIFDQFQQKTPIEFAQTLNLMRTAIQGNALMAVFSTNWRLVMTKESEGRNTSFHGVPVTYTDVSQNRSCSCATLQTCSMPAQLFDWYDALTYTFEGLRLGCYSLETLLSSSLECFYSAECIYEFRQAMEIPDEYLLFYQTLTNGIIELNSTATRFNINDTIEVLANEMFIESWVRNASYEQFFNSCAPTYCTHKDYYRFDALELLTTFLSVYAGLSLGTRILAPLLVKTIQKLRNRCRIAPMP